MERIDFLPQDMLEYRKLLSQLIPLQLHHRQYCVCHAQSIHSSVPPGRPITEMVGRMSNIEDKEEGKQEGNHPMNKRLLSGNAGIFWLLCLGAL